MNLLSFPSLVESPFIIVKIGKYTFGNYSKSGSGSGYVSNTKVTYPNYMDSIDIVKVNGAVNTYTIKMTYGITNGDDPNLLERVFSTISDTRKIVISYGDWASPSFIYKEEEAIVTKIQSSMDFSGSKISYTVSCTSSSLALKAGAYNFPAYASKKPSDLIWSLLKTKSYGLSDIFYGMTDEQKVKKLNLILGDDRAVKIEAKQKITVIDYLNYLVNCMTSQTNTSDGAIKNARYYLSIVDSITGDLNGPYFKITKVAQDTPTINSIDTFEVDIGYPGNNFVTGFTINNDESWSILYKYSNEINQSNYVYKLDDKGKLSTIYSPNITTSSSLQYTTEANRTWWTNMTQYPITASLTIKGLIRPAVLMSYVKVNVWFYGQKHIGSGLYIITRQQDTVDGNGYKTNLTLTRIGGDSL